MFCGATPGATSVTITTVLRLLIHQSLARAAEMTVRHARKIMAPCRRERKKTGTFSGMGNTHSTGSRIYGICTIYIHNKTRERQTENGETEKAQERESKRDKDGDGGHSATIMGSVQEGRHPDVVLGRLWIMSTASVLRKSLTLKICTHKMTHDREREFVYRIP